MPSSMQLLQLLLLFFSHRLSRYTQENYYGRYITTAGIDAPVYLISNCGTITSERYDA